MLNRFLVRETRLLMRQRASSAPLLSHLRPHSMLANPERAILLSVLLHSALLFALLTSTERYGRGFEVTVTAIWTVALWVTFPNF